MEIETRSLRATQSLERRVCFRSRLLKGIRLSRRILAQPRAHGRHRQAGGTPRSGLFSRGPQLRVRPAPVTKSPSRARVRSLRASSAFETSTTFQARRRTTADVPAFTESAANPRRRLRAFRRVTRVAERVRLACDARCDRTYLRKAGELVFLIPKVDTLFVPEELHECPGRRQPSRRISARGSTAQPYCLHESVVMVARERDQGGVALRST
jgi:hypothetical protein